MTFQLVVRSVGRVLWFAIAGAFCMALVGVFAGGVSGGLVIFIQNLLDYRNGFVSRTWRNVDSGVFFGVAYAVVVGLISGAIAFGAAGAMACFSNWPAKIFGASWRLAWRATLVGTAIGGILGPLNALLFALLLRGSHDSFSGYMIGVIAGFIIGTFYGAIVGAKREIARQKHEIVQQQNAALS